jgi:PAS domain S-box-containing protein
MNHSAQVSEKSAQGLTLVQAGVESALTAGQAGVWLYDLEDGTTTCSDGYFDLLGVDPQIGRRQPHFWQSRMHPDEVDHVFGAVMAYSRGEIDSYAQEFRMRHAEGHWIWVFARGRRLPPDPVSGHLAILGFIAAVSDRRATYDRLRQSEERYRLAVAAIAGMVYELDLQTQVIEQHGLTGLLGATDFDPVNGFDAWLERVHADDRQGVQSHVMESRRLARNYDLTYRVLHLDGRLLQVRHRGTYQLGPAGTAVRAFGVVEDVTERRRLEERQQLQSSIIETMKEGVMLLDRRANILFANPALHKLYGYEPGTLTGTNARRLSPRSAEQFDALIRSVFEGIDTHQSSVMDLQALRRDGSVRPIQCLVTAAHYENTPCVITVISDIADRKLIEREMMQVTTRVQQKIGSELHDGLGQQLAGVAMLLKALVPRADRLASTELRASLEGIVDLVNAAVNSTRSLARGLSPVRTDREGMMEGFRELVTYVQDRYQLHVHLRMHIPAAAEFSANAATNLYRIAQEGVINAAKHARPQSIRLELAVENEDVQLLVVDDGVGFDPGRQSGNGMGLRVMSFRAMVMGGYLAVESQPGSGTTLRCRSPLRFGPEVT